ncbi:MAG: OmpA family protein [bacterium]|nr:OmpA family protein [bacterium]
MKKLYLFLFVACIAFTMACGEVKKDPPMAKSTGIDWSAWVNTSNGQLEKFPVAGFGYKSSKVPSQKWDAWAKDAAPAFKTIIDKLPSGYVLQVTGHTDARGPEEPVGRKPGNKKISADRAKSVQASLKKQGIDSPKLVSKGVGSDRPMTGVDPKDASQRRVTFVIVPE